MSAEAVTLDYQHRPAEVSGHPLGDREIADRTQRAVAELQDAIDAARLAGLIVEPSFTRIENRLTQCGARVDSFVGRVHVLRRLA
jgi:hypothetical protein